MSITTEIERLQNAKKDIKEAIENKGVSVGNGLLDTYADKINQIETGVKPTGSIDITENGTYDVTNKATAIVNVASGSSEYPIIEGNGEFEVRFVDYDGTLIKIQYVNKGESATAPSLPTHDRLKFVEWNRDFDNVTHDLDVGALYDTISGNTELFIKLTEETGLGITLNFKKNGATDNIVINWGDGQTSSTDSGATVKQLTHTYSSYGEYMISMSYDYNYILGGGTVDLPLIKGSNEINIFKTLIKCYCSNYMIYTYAYCFYNNVNLEEFTASSMTEIQAYSFVFNKIKALIHGRKVNILGARNSINCQNLEYYIMCDKTASVSLPMFIGSNVKKVIMSTKRNSNSVSYLGTYNRVEYIWYPKYTGTSFALSSMFCANNPNMKKFSLYDNTNNFGSGIFQNSGIETMKIPPLITKIPNSLFNGCYGLHDIYCYPKTPPTLGGTGVFSSTNTLLRIHVPAESLEAYQTATNWSAQATKIVGDLEGEFEDGYN